jgi:hypothetical protein
MKLLKLVLLLLLGGLVLRRNIRKATSEPNLPTQQFQKGNRTANSHEGPSDKHQDDGSPIYTVAIQPSAKDQDEQSYWKKQIRVSKVLNWITTLAAGATIAGLIYLKGTLDATQETVKIAQVSLEKSVENFKVQQRAYVMLAGRGPFSFVNGPPKAGQRILVNIFFENSGQSPATDVQNAHGILLNPIAKPFEPDDERIEKAISENPDGLSTKDTPRSVLPPKGSNFMTAGNTINIVLSDREFDVLTKGHVQIAVFGVISYKDIFSDVHETKFCSVYVHNQAWRYCRAHNQTTYQKKTPLSGLHLGAKPDIILSLFAEAAPDLPSLR